MWPQLGEELYRYRVPLAVPVQWGGTWHTCREGLLLRRTFEGIGEAWGEIAPLPGFSRERLQDVMPGAQPRGAPVSASVVCGRESAHLLLSAQHSRAAGVRRRTIQVCALLTGTRSQVLEQAQSAQAAGYSAVKVKVGRQSVGEDIRLVRDVRQCVGAAIELRLDANRAWTMHEADLFAHGIKGYDVAFVEEPLARPDQLPELASTVPIALDESLTEFSLGELSQHRYARAIVIKPMLLGGPQIALAWASYASHLGIVPVISAAFETGIGMLALLHTVGRMSSAATAGLDTYRYIARDVLNPRLKLSAPRVSIPLTSSITVDYSLLTRIA